MTRPVLRDSGPAPRGAGVSRRLLLSASSSAAALMPALARGQGQTPGPSAPAAEADPRQAAVLILDPGSVDARIQFAAILVLAVADGVSTSIEQDKARIEQLTSEALQRQRFSMQTSRILR